MNKEDKELLLQDLCARLPYGVIVQYKQKTFNPYSEYTVDVKIEIDKMLHHRLKLLDFKTYLRPMSSMTDEEKKELNNILEFQYYSDDSCMCESTDWLNAHHFDYRGLIEKGLAIEASEDMYK